MLVHALEISLVFAVPDNSMSRLGAFHMQPAHSYGRSKERSRRLQRAMTLNISHFLGLRLET